jgi:hypothetical protein
MYEPNSSTKIIGFDFFDQNNTLSSLNDNTQNTVLMQQVLVIKFAKIANAISRLFTKNREIAFAIF